MTMLEVLVALGFIAVFSAGIAALAITLVTSNAKAKSMDIAVFLAHDRLEAIRNTPYASIMPTNFPPEGYRTIVAGSPPVAFPDHQRSVTVQDNTPNAGVKRVVVTVSWRDGSVSQELLVGQ
jgi:Tfp pilus assembly protein PilV